MPRHALPLAVAATAVAACAGRAAAYSVSATRLRDTPLISAYYPGASAGSQFTFSYNAALFVDPSGRIGVMARCQNNTLPCPSGRCQQPSVLAVSWFTDGTFTQATPITGASVVFQPANGLETGGTEDPRVQINPATGEYYLWYTAWNHSVPRLALATGTQPASPTAWNRQGLVYDPAMRESKSASAIFGSGGQPSVLLWGDGPINLAVSQDTLQWNTTIPGFINMRDSGFDSALCEGGPPALPLSDGSLFYIYNSAQHGWPSPKPQWDLGYNVAWAVLNSSDPSGILQRCNAPILSPQLDWETGNSSDPTSPAFSLTPNVVFVEGMLAWPGQPDTFLIVYGAADSHIGVAKVTVTV